MGRQSHGLANCLNGGLGPVGIHIHITAELRTRRQIAQYYIGIRDCGFSTAHPISCGTGLRTCTLRTNPQGFSEFRHIGDRTTTGTNRTHIDRR